MTLIGPKPPGTPKYAAPFEAINGIVYDVDGVEIAGPNTGDSEDDVLLAQAIADALNEKFGGSETTAESAPEPAQLRTLIAWRSDDSLVDDQRAYEVEPGVFVWSSSRASAEKTTELVGGWALPNPHGYRFVDVETGRRVVGG